MPPLRVLVVDDYEPFRRAVRLILQPRDEIQVIAEASDGFEAVQKAVDLRPDLVLLDIGLPALNGIQVARRLRDLVPRTRVLFLTAESSPDVVLAALNAGAVAYVDKLDVVTELLPAIDMINTGRPSVSGGVASGTKLHGHNRVLRQDRQPSTPAFRHEVAFYVDDASFVAGFARFVEATTASESVALAIVTESHRSGIHQRLHGHSLTSGDLINQENYISLDADDMLSRFMVNDWPDATRFSALVDDFMDRATKTTKKRQLRIVACGELAPTLWAKGNRRAALRVEQLWNDVAARHGVDTLCGYVLNSPHIERQLEEFKNICAEHSLVYFR